MNRLGRQILQKTQLLVMVFMLLIPVSIFSFGGDGWEISAQSSLDINLLFPEIDRIEQMYDSEYLEGFNNRPLVDLGLSLFHGPWTFQTEIAILSLRPPIVLDTRSLFSPMVKRAYLEYDSPFIYMSIGRRKQSIGISDHNMFVNRNMPSYDGINISVGKETGFRFDSLISAANTSRMVSVDGALPIYGTHDDPSKSQFSKYFMYHALSYTGETWYAMIGEAAILGNPKTPADLSVFTNIHNENSERANVAIEIQAAKTFKEDFLIYIMGAVDDLPMLASHSDPDMLAKTPNAVGLGIGFRWHAIRGEQFAYPSFNSDTGIRKNTQFGTMSGGLIVSLDYTALSRWMYVRTDQHHSASTFFPGYQSFYNYFFNPWFVSEPDHFALPYGAKYGGDSQLIALKGTYETEKTKVVGTIELALLGQDAQDRYRDTDYWGNADLDDENPAAENYSTKWITSGNIQPLLVVDVSVERGITSWLTAYAGASVLTASFIDDRFVLNLGVTAGW
jgi:hypothetical protein